MVVQSCLKVCTSDPEDGVVAVSVERVSELLKSERVMSKS
jgi:hypothetical protein